MAPADVFHPLTEIFPTVGGDQDLPAIGSEQGRDRSAFQALDRHVQGVDGGVSGDEDMARVDTFAHQVGAAAAGWSEMIRGNGAGELAVHFFGEGAVDVAGAEPGFHVTDGYLLIKGSQ